MLRELVTGLPRENFIYVADSGHCPYGDKSREQIVARAVVITDFLLTRSAKLVVVACNTATIAAVEQLRATYPLSFVGIEPAVKPAAVRSRSGVIGVLATGAALGGEKLHRLIDRHKGPVRVITQPCPGLVEQVEAGDLGGERTRALVQRYTAPLLDAGADVIVLGCTHYPFLRPLIADVVGQSVSLLDTGEAVARRVVGVLDEQRLRATRTSPGRIEWFTSGSNEQMRRVGSALWGAPVEGLSL